MKIIIATQCFENYAWDENGCLGVGENAYWKAKGGTEYVVENVPVAFAMDRVAVLNFVEKHKADIEVDNDGWREYIVDWYIADDDHLSWFEKAQLEHDGVITSFDPRIQFA